MSNCDSHPFSGCNYSRKLVSKLLTDLNIQQFVETGTHLGNTTEYISYMFPHTIVKTIEIDQNKYNFVKKRLSKYKNTECILGSSNEELQKFDKKGLSTMYYLDAHWTGYNPLKDELKCIESKTDGRDVIVIDDFCVPLRNFFHDTAPEGGVLDFNYIKNCLNWDNWVYFYKDQVDNPGSPTDYTPGQIYIVHKNLNLPSKYIKMENGVPFSNID